MAWKGEYKRIPNDEDDEEVSVLSAVFFRWMNGILKKGSERPLDSSDFLPLSKENSTMFLTNELRANWNSERRDCKRKGKRPKLWKSALRFLSVKDAMIIYFGNTLFSSYRIMCPLLLGYLVSNLMSGGTGKNLYFYGCALTLCFLALIGGLGMHQQSYRCELLGIRVGSALRGLVYRKVSAIKKILLFFKQRHKLNHKINKAEHNHAT